MTEQSKGQNAHISKNTHTHIHTHTRWNTYTQIFCFKALMVNQRIKCSLRVGGAKITSSVNLTTEL